jgi:predicted RNase H-like HicB family nuclease
MSAKLKNSKGQALDRPFDPAILAKARAIMAEYQIVIAFEDGEWYGHGLELPGAHGDGKTPQAAVADTRDAMVGVVAYMLEEGQRPPEPAREGHRSVQINIRVTPEEKAVLETRSRAKGFRGLSDFIRASVLVEK